MSRGQVVKHKDGDQFKVFFVDYGDYDTIPVDEIYPIDDMLISKLPFQAIKCSIDGIIPPKYLRSTAEAWEHELGDFIWEKTHDDKNCHFEMLAHVIQELNDHESFFKHRSYLVDLYVHNLPLPVNIANIIVSKQYADFSESKEAELFPYVQKNNQETSASETVNFLNCLSKLCFNNFVK